MSINFLQQHKFLLLLKPKNKVNNITIIQFKLYIFNLTFFYNSKFHIKKKKHFLGNYYIVKTLIVE